MFHPVPPSPKLLAAVTRAPDKLKVFVSYSRADLEFALQLVLALQDRGFEPLLDRRSIDAAEEWKIPARRALAEIPSPWDLNKQA